MRPGATYRSHTRGWAALTALMAALTAVLLLPTPGQAAQTTLRPVSEDARSFADSDGGWTSAVVTGGVCVPLPGITCPTATPTYVADGGSAGAGDGFLRNSVSNALGLATDVTVSRTSPSFAIPTDTDQARLSMNVRSDLGSFLTLLGGSVRADMVLRDDTVPASSITLAQNVPLSTTSTFTPIGADVPAGQLDPSHSYSVVVRTVFRTGLAALVTTGSVDIDDVQLRLVDLEPPNGLSASASTSGPLAINGSVNPNGQPTAVTVDYGLQGGGLTSSTSPVVVSGSGAQNFSIPLAGLQPGATYDYRATAQNADGSAHTTTSSFTAPTPPANSPPSVSGALNSRDRSVTYDPGTGTTSARVEVLDGGGNVIATVPDPGLDGQVNITLPAGDGTYSVRIVRDGSGGSSTSAGVPVTLDRVAPSLAGANLAVTPIDSSDRARSVTFTTPPDAVSAEVQVLDSADNPVGAPVMAAGGTASVQLGATDGVYSVRLTVRDAAGNAASTDSGALTLDSAAPGAGGAPVVTGDGNDRDRQVSFDRDPSTATATIEILDESGQVLDTVAVPADDNAFIQLPDADGDYAVRVRQLDAAGNAAITGSTPVSLDRVAPAPGTAPTVSGDGNSRQRTVTFQRDPSTTRAQIEIMDSGGNRVGALIPVTGASTPITLPNADGDYAVRVLQSDAAGNQSTSPDRDVTLDRVPPNAGGAPTVSGTPDALTVTFARDPSAIAAAVEIVDSGGNVVSRIPVSGNSTTTSLPAAAGSYDIRVVQTDAAGNSATSPGTTRTREAGNPTTDTGTPGGGGGGTGAGGGRGGGGNTLGAPGTLSDPGGLGASLANCLGGNVALTDVYRSGYKVRMVGVSRYAPRTPITLRDAAGRTVARSKTDRLGRFGATAKLPARKARRSARYQAIIATSRSLKLHLERRNRLSSVRVKGGRATVRGTLAPGVRSRLRRTRSFRLVVLGGRGAAGCRGGKALRAIGKPKINRRTGRYRLTVRAPAGNGPLVLRDRLLRPVKAFSQFVVR